MIPAESRSRAEAQCTAAVRELAVWRTADRLLYVSRSSAGKPLAGATPPTHTAAYPEFIYVRSGVLDLVTPLGLIHITPSQLLMIDVGVEHGEIYGGDVNAVFFVIYDSNVQIFEVDRELNATSAYLLGSTDLRYMTDAVGTELATRDLDFEGSVYGLLRHFAAIATRRITRGSYLTMPWLRRTSEADPRSWRVVIRVLGYLAANFSTSIDAADAAEQVGYNTAYLNRLFSRYLGTSISKCLRQLRMTHARNLLLHSNLSIDLIAGRVGYSDPSNFRRAFVSATGISLKEFRLGKVRWPDHPPLHPGMAGPEDAERGAR